MTPQLRETANGGVLCKPASSFWCIDGASCTGSQMRITLCKYPGDQARPCLAGQVDCERKVAWVEDSDGSPLAPGQFEAAL